MDTLKVWDLGSGRELCTLAGHTGRVTAVAVTPDERRAVSASANKTLKGMSHCPLSISFIASVSANWTNMYSIRFLYGGSPCHQTP